jgi:hypothetical protein
MVHTRFNNNNEDMFKRKKLDLSEEKVLNWVAAFYAVSLALTAYSAYNNYENAKDQKKALEQEKDLKVKERQKNTKLLIARQKVSFLNSGISLTGEGTPQNMFDETERIGLEDVEQIKSNYGQAQKNLMSSARSSLFSSLAGMASSVASKGMSGSSASNTQGVNTTLGGSRGYSGGMESGLGVDTNSLYMR